MKKGVSYLALGIGLLTETPFALEQSPSPMLVAQVTGTVPPSGALIAPPPAPVAVPPSGVLTTDERHAVTTIPFKTVPMSQTTKRATPVRVPHHVRHLRSVAHRKTITRTQSTATTPSVVIAPAVQPRRDGIGYELFQFGKGKVKEPARRFPLPWHVDEATKSFCIRDANGEALAYVYFEDGQGRRMAMHRLTRSEARRSSSKHF